MAYRDELRLVNNAVKDPRATESMRKELRKLDTTFASMQDRRDTLARQAEVDAATKARQAKVDARQLMLDERYESDKKAKIDQDKINAAAITAQAQASNQPSMTAEYNRLNTGEGWDVANNQALIDAYEAKQNPVAIPTEGIDAATAMRLSTMQNTAKANDTAAEDKLYRRYKQDKADDAAEAARARRETREDKVWARQEKEIKDQEEFYKLYQDNKGGTVPANTRFRAQVGNYQTPANMMTIIDRVVEAEAAGTQPSKLDLEAVEAYNRNMQGMGRLYEEERPMTHAEILQKMASKSPGNMAINKELMSKNIAEELAEKAQRQSEEKEYNSLLKEMMKAGIGTGSTGNSGADELALAKARENAVGKAQDILYKGSDTIPAAFTKVASQLAELGASGTQIAAAIKKVGDTEPGTIYGTNPKMGTLEELKKAIGPTYDYAKSTGAQSGMEKYYKDSLLKLQSGMAGGGIETQEMKDIKSRTGAIIDRVAKIGAKTAAEKKVKVKAEKKAKEEAMVAAKAEAAAAALAKPVSTADVKTVSKFVEANNVDKLLNDAYPSIFKPGYYSAKGRSPAAAKEIEQLEQHTVQTYGVRLSPTIQAELDELQFAPWRGESYSRRQTHARLTKELDKAKKLGL